MARTIEDFVKAQLGEQALIIAALQAQVEGLLERIKELEAEQEKEEAE